MDALPNDIIGKIFKHADVPIDTFLEYRKKYDISPKKLVVASSLQHSLNTIFNRRAREYTTYKQQYEEANGFIDCYRLDKFFSHPSQYTSIEMGIFMIRGVLQYSYMVLQVSNINPQYVSIRRSNSYDMISGKEITLEYE